jgi:hypothetical protein
MKFIQTQRFCLVRDGGSGQDVTKSSFTPEFPHSAR